MIPRHHLHSPYKRAIYSFSLISIIMFIGTIGLHLIEKMSYLDAFYLMSMIATAQGPAHAPETAAGKIFVALISFVSVGAGVAALGFLFGPFFGQIWWVGVVKLEEELEHIKTKHPKK
jgi:hypothetical protein